MFARHFSVLLIATSASCSAAHEGAPADAAADASSDAACTPAAPANPYDASQPYACNESRQTIASTRAGVTLPFDLVEPAGAPKGIVLLLPGGEGTLQLATSSTEIPQGADNFVVRTRQTYALAGYVAVAVDVPSDHAQGLDDFRATPDHADDLSAIIQWLRARYATAPELEVWIVATSRGTISAVDVAVNKHPPAGPDHIILTSSVTSIPASATDQEDIQSVTGYETALAAQTPILMIDNAMDACGAAKPANAEALATSIDDSASFVTVTGGTTPPANSDPCGPLSYHGFYGLEPTVMDMILAQLGG